jgi:protein-tyrosine phosphatase
MEVFQIDEAGQLFIAPDVDDWSPIRDRNINVVFDMDDDLDVGVPEIPNQLVYVYFPFEDKELPDTARLQDLARCAAQFIRTGNRVLCHCGMGHNRSALVAGVILTYLGMPGRDAVALIRSKRQGALYNRAFAGYLMGLAPVKEA